MQGQTSCKVRVTVNLTCPQTQHSGFPAADTNPRSDARSRHVNKLQADANRYGVLMIDIEIFHECYDLMLFQIVFLIILHKVTKK